MAASVSLSPYAGKTLMLKTYLLLFSAIVCETVGTAFLKQSDGLTRLWPTLVTVAGYGLSFYFLAIVLRSMPVGIAYAIWSGVGIVLIGLIGYFVFRQTLDFPALLGMGLIVAGVLVINLFSKSVSH